VTGLETAARKPVETRVVEKVVERVVEGRARRTTARLGRGGALKARNEICSAGRRSEADFRRVRSSYGELVKTYRLIKRSNELLEHELDYRKLGRPRRS